MSSVSEGVGIDETLHSLSFNTLWKVQCLFLEGEKIAFTLSSLFTVFYSFFIFVSLFDVEGLENNSTEGVVWILGRQGENVWFTFEVDDLLDKEGLGKVKQ